MHRVASLIVLVAVLLTMTLHATGQGQPALDHQSREVVNESPNRTDRANSLPVLLRRAGEAVVQFVEAATLVVGEERYDEESYRRLLVDRMASSAWLGTEAVMTPEHVGTERRRFVSEVVLVQTPDSQETGVPWMEFRDLVSVDGKAIRGSDGRLRRLFSPRSTNSISTARALTAESRIAIAPVRGTLNLPGLALLALHPLNQGRFAFKLGPDAESGDWAPVELQFAETSRPTLARNLDGSDNPMNGRVWLDARDGRAVKTALSVRGPTAWVDITTTYRRDAKTRLNLPVEMSEEAYDAETDVTVQGRARYRNYRLFETSGRSVGVPIPNVPAPGIN